MTARHRPDPARIAEFAATARKLQQERARSAEVVSALLRDTPVPEWTRLAEREELRNSGALEELSREGIARIQKDPRHALAIAEVEVAIADALSPLSYPPIVFAQVRAHAWKDYGQALWYLARYDEALKALDHAEALLAPYGTLAHDRAIVQLVRACTLQDINHFDESLNLLARCRTVFHDHGDSRRHLICGIAEGTLLQRLKRYREAREVDLLLLDVAREAGDHESLACLHINIGHASVELGDFAVAENHLARAVEILTIIREPLRITRVALARGRMYLRRGETERGLSHLRATRERFLRYGLIEEAGVCGLDIVEALLTNGNAAEAERFARAIVAEFAAADLDSRAITALGLLTEAIAERKASAASVADVRELVSSLRRACHASA